MTRITGEAQGASALALVSTPEAVQVLLDASAMLLASSNVEEVLAGIVELARQLIHADAYAVWRTYDGLNWRVLASSGLPDSYRIEVQTSTPHMPKFQAVSDVEDEASLHHFLDVYKSEGIRSLLVVPLRFSSPMPEGPNAGTITFYWRARHVCSDLDVSYASTLANLSSAALNISELNEQSAREKARFAFLAEASAVLASSLDYEETLQRVAKLAVSQIADWCTVHVVENGVPNRIVVAHSDPAMLQFAKQYSERFPEQIRSDRGIGLVLRTGETEVYPRITDEIMAAAIPDPEQLEMIRRLQVTSSILVPLTSRGKVLGALRLISCRKAKSFDEDDVRLAEALGRRAAAAIENAQLHRAIVEQQERLHLSHAAARMGTWHWDLGKQRMAWSDEFRELHGLAHNSASTAGEGPGLIHPEDRDRVLREMEDTMSSGAEYITVEHRAVAVDGRSFWIHSRGRIERDAQGKAVSVLGISMDVTERHQAEEALRKSEKLATAGRLAATIAHEINNPLESIVNLVYLTRHTKDVPEEAAAYLAKVDKELTRMTHMVRQTLGFYRESSEPRDSDLCQIVLDGLDIYRQKMQARSIRCETHFEPPISARLIPGELKQVTANLIANAIDATEPGGCISVEVKRNDKSVSIAVSDSGSGIEKKYLPRLFEPFFTTKEEFGTGLGLWVTKGIVEKHKGTIAVTSSTDPAAHGTKVTISLPL